MTFLVIFGCLVAERFLLRYQSLRKARWFERWLDIHQSLPVSRLLREGRAGLILLLFPPLLAVGLLQSFFDELLLGIPGLLFAALVLLYSLGPEDLDSRVAAWTESGGLESEAGSRDLASALLERPTDAEGAELEQELTDGVLSYALVSYSSVLFWFLLLGPLGALGYRLTRQAKGLAEKHGRHGLGEPIRALLFLLDWLPARMLAGLYALAGSFEPAIQGWRGCIPAPEVDANAALVSCAGSGALAQPQTGGDSINGRVETAMALVWRSLVLFLILLGLVTISGWIL